MPVRTLIREGTSRRHAVLVVAVLTAAVHGIVIANEEFRHVWALLGLIGLAGVPRWAQGEWWKEEEVDGSRGATEPAAAPAAEPAIDEVAQA